jgi:hypothetical protein
MKCKELSGEYKSDKEIQRAEAGEAKRAEHMKLKC